MCRARLVCGGISVGDFQVNEQQFFDEVMAELAQEQEAKERQRAQDILDELEYDDE